MREENPQKIEVHVAAVCFNGHKVLVLKRSGSRNLYPNLWECGGGQVEAGENFEEAVVRQLRQEAGITAEPMKVFKTYEISLPEEDQKKIPGVKILCKFIEGDLQPSKEHTEVKWQPIDKLDELEFISGLKEDIEEAYSIWKDL